MQLALFEPPKRVTSNDLMWERAFSPSVEREVLATLEARRGKWLDWNDFRAIIDRHRIGACFGHALGAMARKGVIRRLDVYYGSATPADGNYLGFGSRWSAV